MKDRTKHSHSVAGFAAAGLIAFTACSLQPKQDASTQGGSTTSDGGQGGTSVGGQGGNAIGSGGNSSGGSPWAEGRKVAAQARVAPPWPAIPREATHSRVAPLAETQLAATRRRAIPQAAVHWQKLPIRGTWHCTRGYCIRSGSKNLVCSSDWGRR